MDCQKLIVLLILVAGGALPAFQAAPAAEQAAPGGDEQAIRAAARQYVEALSRRDAKAMQALWTPDGDIVDELGHSIPAGRMIEEEAKATGAAPRPDVKVTASTIRFLSADVALEDGAVDLTSADKALPPTRGRFTAIWVKRDSQWRLASLREARVPSTGAEDMAALEPLVGEWSGQMGAAKFHVSTRWNDKHTYLLRDLTVTRDGRAALNGAQRIGIDPLDGKIKSWMHDADGGHAEGTWTRQGRSWIVQATGVSPDGKRTSSTNVYTLDDPNTLTWKSTGTLAEGRPVPDFEIKLQREPVEKK